MTPLKLTGSHAAPPRIRGNIAVRSTFLGVGLVIFAIGIVSIYESKLGLSPWDVLNQGVARHTPLSFGTANIAIALVILVVARRLDVRLRVGTIANALLVGTFVDVLLRIGTVQHLSHDNLAIRVLLLIAGIAVIGFGTAVYLGAGLGAGPRDSLMLGLTQRVRSRIGVVRTFLEISATAAGFALGGTVGIGTLAFALGIGPAIELSFAALRRSPLAAVRAPVAVPVAVQV
ncbi:MAG: hypothetical protein ABI317_13460 [Gaiellales bacterium]